MYHSLWSWWDSVEYLHSNIRTRSAELSVQLNPPGTSRCYICCCAASVLPLSADRQCQQWRCFPLKAPQNSFCLLLLFFHKWAIQQEERDDGWHSGTWMALCTWVPQQHQTACKAVSGVLCPKSSSSSHNKPFLWTKLIAEEKRTVNFDNHKPPIVSFQF